MPEKTSFNQLRERLPGTIWQVLRSRIMWVGLAILLALLSFVAAIHWAGQDSTPAPADLFMQSVVERDGNLGWHQLCPALQAQLPLSTLVKQVERLRLMESEQGLTFTMTYIGNYSKSEGGQIRFYVVKKHIPDGREGLRTYVIYTQASGCVEDVKNF